MDSIKTFVEKIRSIVQDRVQAVAEALFQDGNGFANSEQLEGVDEAVIGRVCPGLKAGERNAIVQAAKTSGIIESFRNLLLLALFSFVHCSAIAIVGNKQSLYLDDSVAKKTILAILGYRIPYI